MDTVQQNPEPPQTPKKYFSKLLPIFISVLALVIIAVISYLFMQKNKDLTYEIGGKTKEAELLKTKNNELEKELIFLKNTDLAKELEIVNLKLQKSDEELNETKLTVTSTQKGLKDLQTSVSSIPKVTNILSLMYGSVAGNPGQCFSENSKTKVSQALVPYGDKTWTDMWNSFITNTDSSNCSWSPMEFQRSLDYGLNKINDSIQ